MLFAGDHDDRVVPLHSHKLTATLQHVLCEDADAPQRNPLVTRIDVRAGHGAGKPTEKIIAGALTISHPDLRHCRMVKGFCKWHKAIERMPEDHGDPGFNARRMARDHHMRLRTAFHMHWYFSTESQAYFAAC